MNEELDTEWINEIENIEKDNDIFYKEKINEITLIFLYINNNELENIKKNYFDLQEPSVLSKETLIDIINKNKINNSIKYSLSGIFKFNINIEPEHIKNFVADNYTENDDKIFFSKIKNIDDITWDDSINMFEHLNTLFFIFNIKKISTAQTKKIVLKKNITRKKLI